jgi:choice-of-anchor A domain-containing protein
MRRILLAAATLIVMAAPAVASAETAADFNLFVLGDMKVRSSDTEGRVAVGGNASLDGYTIGLMTPTGTDLVVGGSLYATGGTTFGDVRAASLVGNTGTPADPSWSHGAITVGAPTVDFAAEGTRLVALSNYLDTYANTGTVDQVCWGSPGSNCYQLTFNATQAGLNVFDIDASILSDTNTITINLGAGSSILVNVSGTSLQLDGGMSVNGGNASQVLFNLKDATSFKNGNFGMMGSVLAPNAAVVGGGGQLNGQLIVKSFTGDSWYQFAQGNTQINNVKFAGDLLTLTPPGAVPEPASWALMIGGFGMAGALLRRKRAVATA